MSNARPDLNMTSLFKLLMGLVFLNDIYARGGCRRLKVKQVFDRRHDYSHTTVVLELLDDVDKMKLNYQSNIYFNFSIDLKHLIDYSINFMTAENTLRNLISNTSSNSQLVALNFHFLEQLNEFDYTTNLTSVMVCDSKEDIKKYKAGEKLNLSIRIHKANKIPCEDIDITRLSEFNELYIFLSKHISHCSGIIYKTPAAFVDFRISPIKAYSTGLKAIIVDSLNHNTAKVAVLVDRFLTVHSFMDLVWEPYELQDLNYFIMIPRPTGIPGHLLALIDHIQWHHPSLNRPDPRYQCKRKITEGCKLGCDKTFLSRVTGCGFGADTWHIMLDIRRAVMWNEPVQITPLRFTDNKIGSPEWKDDIGYTYTYGTCDSNFLDCIYLNHSPCPKINIDPYDALGDDRSRVRAWNIPNISQIENEAQEGVDTWWKYLTDPSVNDPKDDVPQYAIGGLYNTPAEQTFYAYSLKPKYEIRKTIHNRVQSFNLTSECAVMHIRRGDAVTHDQGLARAYIRLDSYVSAGRPLMDAMGIKTIFLLTDSQEAVEEAMDCANKFPHLCKDVQFKFVNKKRWHGTEGGWENHFPSGSPKEELFHILTEFTLAQKCQMIVMGSSNYGQYLHNHMCCGFPLHPQGKLPHRCICPPVVRVSQEGFSTCEEGNILLCPNNTVDAEQFSKRISLLREPKEWYYESNYGTLTVSKNNQYDVKVVVELELWMNESLANMCKTMDRGQPRPSYCNRII